MKRDTLTKSLHTVTAVSRLAKTYRGPVGERVNKALATLGQPGPWKLDDPTYVACIKAAQK